MLEQKQSFVELESGDQLYFDNTYEAFKFAKEQEELERHSVAFVAISKYDDEGEFDFEATELTVYRGQQLRLMIRSIDNTQEWIRAQLEVKDEKSEDSS